MPRQKVTAWEKIAKLLEKDYRRFYAAKLREDAPLDRQDMLLIAELLCPEVCDAKEKRPAHRPKGTTRTEQRDFNLCCQYLALYEKSGYDSAILTLAEANDLSARVVREAVSGERLERARAFMADSPLRKFLRIGPPKKDQEILFPPEDLLQKNSE